MFGKCREERREVRRRREEDEEERRRRDKDFGTQLIYNKYYKVALDASGPTTINSPDKVGVAL